MKYPANVFAIWLTGMPCSGKTTISYALQKELNFFGIDASVLDGDVLRKEISKDLGYSRQDRETHISRVTDLAESLQRRGTPVIVALISPYAQMRAWARDRLSGFIEVYLRCPLHVCEARDVKGMYRLARERKIAQFTGISDVYEEPAAPELALDTDRTGVDSCVASILDVLTQTEYQYGTQSRGAP